MKVEFKYWKDSEGRRHWTYLSDRAPEGAQSSFDNLRFFRFDRDIERSIERGYSVNHVSGNREAGLSCYWLQDCGLSGRNEIVSEIEREWNATGYLRCNGDFLPLWEIEGRIVGYGSDGEPLLSDVVVVGRIN